MDYSRGCLSCQSIQGINRISPGITIFEGEYWLLEHAYPTGLKGWLVIVLKRHVEAFHELSEAELSEWAIIIKKATKLLKQIFNCEKEYLMTFCEKDGFSHLHTHVVPRLTDIPPETKGTKIFTYLKTDAIPEADIIDICQRLAEEFSKL